MCELPVSRYVVEDQNGLETNIRTDVLTTLGLPAFEPGQKVEIDFSSDDI